MGFLDLFKPKVPTVQSILPDVAVQEILKGHLPILNTDKIFLKPGEKCRYIDKAIFEKRTVQKRYIRRNHGTMYPGLIFKDVKHTYGGGTTDVTENVQYSTHRGILYITNRRIIFVGQQEGFDKPLSDLIAIQPYSNCVELQFNKDTYKIFVPNGVVVHAVLRQVK